MPPRSVFVLTLALAPSAAFSLAPRARPFRARATGRAHIVAETAGTATAELAAAQQSALDLVVAELGLFAGDAAELALSDSAATLATVRAFVSEEKLQDSAALGIEESRRIAQGERTVAARKKADVAWCSALDISGPEYGYSSLTCWGTPVVDVPHFFCAVGVSDGGIDLALDFLPRADAGYEMALPDGSYPEPTDRAMFAKGGVRKELSETFFTDEALAWADSLRALEGASAPPTPSRSPIPVGGPLRVEVRLPLSEASVGACVRACADASTRWVGWMGAAERLEQTKTMLVFAHDAKVRALVDAATAAHLERAVGPAGRDLAAADAGPTDLVDRGGALNAAASTNFDDDERDKSIVDMQTLQEGAGWTEPGKGNY